MATIQQANPKAAWRKRLRPASFARARFHVEQQSRSSGMRTVIHEYPKRNIPYAEIMGRHAIRYQVTGYCIGPNYHLEKEQLMNVLEKSEPGELIDPYLPTRPLMCVCERFSVSESREKGGFCTFEMVFVELGTPANAPAPNTAQNVINQSNTTGAAGSNTLNNAAKNFVTGATP
jgi:prophage DNA circulation protein